jgi:drug/metabolite transporter (DMT)-like permease
MERYRQAYNSPKTCSQENEGSEDLGGLALSIVLASAVLHASWNYLTKKSQRKLPFIWLALLTSLFLFLPMFLYYWPETAIYYPGWNCILASGLLHAFYFWFLGGAYERGDLSLVYPLSRGSGPLLVPLFAVILLHEQLTLPGITGIAVVVLGIYSIHLQSFSLRSFLQPFLAARGRASLWALFTGAAITSYSLVDKVGVDAVYPPVYIYLMLVGTVVFLSPSVLLRERAWLKQEWAENKRSIIIVGFLANFTYLMVLFAMSMSRVSYVVAVREVSIVFSAFFGVMWLGEKHAAHKLLGAFLITLGVILIALSR